MSLTFGQSWNMPRRTPSRLTRCMLGISVFSDHWFTPGASRRTNVGRLSARKSTISSLVSCGTQRPFRAPQDYCFLDRGVPPRSAHFRLPDLPA